MFLQINLRLTLFHLTLYLLLEDTSQKLGHIEELC